MFFPNSVMPKSLRKETSKEVDDSPLVYNARDYNVHHRELRAIQQFLIGPAGFDGTVDGTSLNALVQEALATMRSISNGALLAQFSGVVASGTAVPIPAALKRTTTSGDVAAAATTIGVGSTDSFPESGYITKFNALGALTTCSDGSAPVADRCPVGAVKSQTYAHGTKVFTNQEVIRYGGKTATSFLDCARSQFGSTAQAVDADSPALILSGRASFSLWLASWEQTLENVLLNEIFIGHDAGLVPLAQAFEPGSRTRLKTIDEEVLVGYLLTTSGDFSVTPAEQAFGA